MRLFLWHIPLKQTKKAERDAVATYAREMLNLHLDPAEITSITKVETKRSLLSLLRQMAKFPILYPKGPWSTNQSGKDSGTKRQFVD